MKQQSKLQLRQKVQALIFLSASLIPSVSNAELARIQTSVDRIMHISSDNFGSCMIRVNDSLENSGIGCKDWVTFSCTGDFTTKDSAYRMFDMAQMSFALNKQVLLLVTNQKKHNGYCFVERIDVLD